MSSNTLLETSTKNLSDVFTNGRIYRIPQFQRDYSWNQENWEDLWIDIVAQAKESQPHYMGAIVLQPGQGSLIVIDGQQRLATLSILTLAILRRLRQLRDQGVDPQANEERYALLFNQFIGGKDPASLRYSSKLFLNENDDSFYQQNLVNFRPPLNPRALKESEKRLWDAYEFFAKKVDELFKPQSGGDVLAGFVSDIVGKKLIFIQILVQDEVSAYTVFETLNARGLGLTTTDLLKNYLFATTAASSTDLSHVRQQWKKITDIVGMREFPDFLRHFLNSQQAYVRTERLFKAIREKVKRRDEVFALLDALEKAAYWYKALNDHNDELWADYPGCAEQVRYLRLFRVSQFKPVILACAGTFTAEELRKVLRACVVVSFRFNVICQKSTHVLEDIYNKVAVEIFSGRYRNAGHAIAGLMPIYIQDDEFKNAFEVTSLSTRSKRKLASYILCKIETQLSTRDLDYETAQATIEHILPENPSAGWDDFSGEDRERFTYRLGNYALLEQGPNRDLGNQPYGQKQSVYAQSQYELAKRIQAPTWTTQAILQRQRDMAGWATAIWRME